MCTTKLVSAERLLMTMLLLGCLTGSVTAQEDVSEAEKLFALKVRPLFREKCLGCHGDDEDKIESAFDMRTREAVLRGGDLYGDEVLKPGTASESEMYSLVRREDEDLAMPPKEADKLSEEQTWWIRDWINGGAPWPDDKRVSEIYRRYAEGVTIATSGGLDAEWTNRKYKPENLWAYQPIRRPDSSDGPTGAVDFFINRKLKSLGLESARSADRRTLIRRAAFDLLGLPPAPEEVDAFVNDPRGDVEAFRALVDRLLESPHYGEQWGRHWLDIVRYADSSGFANDWERPNAWRYRDYVIRAFNSDKPYDRFIHEQIAGDEIDPDSVENVIAVGFLRMGPWEHTGMSVAKVTRQQFLDDITDTVGQVFLAHALQCCRCHDHKFDPIPTRDYYSFQAIFANTQFADLDTEWLPDENLTGMAEDKAYLERKLAANREMLADLTAKKAENDRAWFQEKGLPYKSRAEAKAAKAPKEHFPPNNFLKSPDDFGRERIGRKWQARFPWELDRYQPIAFSVYNGKTRVPRNIASRLLKPENPKGPGRWEQSAILKGGDVFAPSEAVSPGVLSAVPGGLEFEAPDSISGRRKALADWLTDPSNTLTARVMVNRIWLYHFGQALAGNPNNFGATGKKPTHPELLDWLASEFVSKGWSIKHMHRLIMNSDAYRRASTHPNSDKLKELDPQRQAYAVFLPRRLAVEELRDAMLTVSGELNRQVGGIPARPDMNLEAALQPRMIMGTFAPSYVPDPKPGQRNRRSIYALKLRGHRDPFLETFNQPGSEKSCELRDSSTVTPQALTLINSEETNDRALAFANRLLKDADDDQAAVRTLFRLAYARNPDRHETAVTMNHWRKMQTIQAKLVFKPKEWPTTVVRRANEENTGEVFTFTEQLFAYQDYVPDLQAHEVDARTRAFADVCLAILNSNEFVYID